MDLKIALSISLWCLLAAVKTVNVLCVHVCRCVDVCLGACVCVEGVMGVWMWVCVFRGLLVSVCGVVVCECLSVCQCGSGGVYLCDFEFVEW